MKLLQRLKGLFSQPVDITEDVVPSPEEVPPPNSSSPMPGRVVRATKHAEYMPEQQARGIVKVMPSKVRKIKEAQERLE
jgi:hypothetical protein